MKKVVKVFCIMLCLLMIISTAAACTTGQVNTGTADGKTDDTMVDPTPTESKDFDITAEPVKLTFPILNTTGDIETHSLVIAGKAYMEKYPNVTFDFIDINSQGYRDKIAVMMASGDKCDLIMAQDLEQYEVLIENGNLEDLASYIQGDNLDLNEIYHGMQKHWMYENKCYGLPYTMSLWLIFFNKDMFDERGVEYPKDGMTWEEYGEICKKMTFGEGAEKVYGGFIKDAVPLLNIATSSGQHTLVDMDDYKWLEYAFNFVFDLQKNGYIMDHGAMFTNNISHLSAFVNKNIATFYQGSWNFSILPRYSKAGALNFKWGVVQGPYLKDGGAPGDAVASINPLSMNVRSENKEATWEFIKFVCVSDEGGDVMSKAGLLPVAGAASGDKDKIKGLLTLHNFPEEGLEAMSFSRLSLEKPMHPVGSEIEELFKETHSLIMTGSIGVEEGIADFAERVAKLKAK